MLSGWAMISPAFAQAPSGDDWDIRDQPAQSIVLATLEYEGAPALAVRCLNAKLGVLVAGLNPGVDEAVQLEVEGFTKIGLYLLADGQTMASEAPALSAHDLQRGGAALVSVSGPDRPTRRYRLPLPAQSRSVASVIAACGSQAADVRYDLPRVDQTDMSWSVRPSGQYPEAAAARGVTWGTTTLSCLVDPSGSPSDCRIEREEPEDAGFGQEALRAVRRARLPVSEDTQAPPSRLFYYRMSFRVE